MIQTQNAIFGSYQRNPELYDEVFDAEGKVKDIYQKLFDLYGNHSINDYVNLNNKAKASFFNQGITFQVYSDHETTDKIFPFDRVPRISGPEVWGQRERGAFPRRSGRN
jgi:uncharacterized circularly permuted ATP-grasp superfamily protein